MSKVPSFEITHYRDGESPEGNTCIGCGLCASINESSPGAGKYWEMDDEEAKSNLINGKETSSGSGIFKRVEINAPQVDYDMNETAMDGCPVGVIKLNKKKP